MKPQRKPQTMLKFALLAVLAANISYSPLKQMVHELDLAQVAPSETASSQGTTAAPAAANPPAADGHETPVTQRGRPVGERGYIEVCDGKQKHRVIFRQIEFNNKPMTVAYAQKVEVADETLVVGRVAKLDGTYDLTKRNAMLEELTKEMKLVHGCPDQAASTSATTTSAAEQRGARAEIEAENKANEAKVRRCEMKKVRNGRNVEFEAIEDDAEMLKCQINRLSNIETEKDDKGKSRSKSAMLSEAEKIVNDKLKRQIRKMLMSKDESEQEEGAKFADDVIDALRELPRSELRVQRMISMFQGYKAGGETARRTREFEKKAREDVNDVRERIVGTRDYLHRNPNDRGALWNMNLALSDHLSLSNQIDNHIAGLQWHQWNQQLNRNEGFTSSEYSELLSPYNQIKRQMEAMLNPSFSLSSGTGISRTFPTGLYDSRISPSQGFSRLGGSSSSAYPLSMPNVRGNLGTLGSVTPAFTGVRSTFPF